MRAEVRGCEHMPRMSEAPSPRSRRGVRTIPSPPKGERARVRGEPVVRALTSALALLAACATVRPTPEHALQDARDAHASSGVLGLAALAELDRGHGREAQALVQRIPADSGDLDSNLARLLVCERNLDVDCQRIAAT